MYGKWTNGVMMAPKPNERERKRERERERENFRENDDDADRTLIQFIRLKKL